MGMSAEDGMEHTEYATLGILDILGYAPLRRARYAVSFNHHMISRILGKKLAGEGVSLYFSILWRKFLILTGILTDLGEEYTLPLHRQSQCYLLRFELVLISSIDPMIILITTVHRH